MASAVLILMGFVLALSQSFVTAVTPAPGNVANGLMLWLDASDPLFTGSAPANGSNVATWKDKSGNANDAAINPHGVGQAHTAAIFESAPSGFNNRPALRFNRIDDNSGSVYEIGNIDIRASSISDITVFSVYRPVALASNNGLWGNDDGNWDRFFITFHPGFGDGTDDGVVGLGPALGGETIANSGSTAVPSLFAISYGGHLVNGANVGDTNGSYVYFNCNLQRTFTDSTHSALARTRLSIGWDGNDSVFDGYIAEVIVYNRVLTSQEVGHVNGYLASKYNLASGCATFATTTTSPTTTTVASTTTVVSTSTTSSTPVSGSALSAPVEASSQLPQTGTRSLLNSVLPLLLIAAGLLIRRSSHRKVQV